MIASVQNQRITPTHTATLSAPAQALRQDVERAAQRGRCLRALSVSMLIASTLAAGLLVFAGLDALVPIPVAMRLALLLALITVTLGVGAWLLVRTLLDRSFTFGTAELIDQVSGRADQPVVRGLSLMPAPDEDDLFDALRQRAEQRAADLTAVTPPPRVYPLGNLRKPAALLCVTVLAWIVLAIIFPAQFGGMLARVLLPWSGAPPFSLTQMDPTWTPDNPAQGDAVTVTVQPEGKPAESVDFVRLDEQGNEAERFAMQLDTNGGFHHTLAGVTEPIHFHLETHGRPTRDYTIRPQPKPVPPAPLDAQEQNEGTANNAGSSEPGGTTRFDPQAAAELVRDAHEDWPALRERIEALMKQLSEAQARAQAIDPSDFDAMKTLEGDLEKMTGLADDLAKDIRAMQADLPPDAAATLSRLLATLEQMQSAALAASPRPGSASSENVGDPATNPTPQQWLKQAGESAGTDSKSLANGLGHSSIPTESGTASGQPDGTAPDFFDPAASGTSDERGTTADTGALPPAVMQQVPPRYRDHIRAYFKELAELEDKP